MILNGTFGNILFACQLICSVIKAHTGFVRASPRPVRKNTFSSVHVYLPCLSYLGHRENCPPAIAILYDNLGATLDPVHFLSLGKELQGDAIHLVNSFQENN